MLYDSGPKNEKREAVSKIVHVRGHDVADAVNREKYRDKKRTLYAPSHKPARIGSEGKCGRFFRAVSCCHDQLIISQPSISRDHIAFHSCLVCQRVILDKPA
ncbi:hypothetical protein J6590_065749 [Homalodisca vitripennis]|nr:hypothetical protein J6590_065749 [Homalodisca vitripennis]